MQLTKPLSKDLERLTEAMDETCFPCNPIPFANGLAEGCRQHGSDFTKSDEGKRILWILMAQAYGQLGTIDLCAEWRRLSRLMFKEGE